MNCVCTIVCAAPVHELVLGADVGMGIYPTRKQKWCFTHMKEMTKGLDMQNKTHMSEKLRTTVNIFNLGTDAYYCKRVLLSVAHRIPTGTCEQLTTNV